MDQSQIYPEKENNKKYVVAVIALLLIAALGIGVSFAYLVAQDSINNRFNLDTNLSISLTEPSFVEENAKNLVPAQVVAKDPTITNDGTVEAYVAATVKVPVFSGKYLDAANALKVAKDVDLFSYTLGNGWSEIGTPFVKDGFSTHTYVYADTLASSASASPIFDSVTLANLTEDAGITDTSIDVTAYAIQSVGFETSQEAYEAYLAQTADAAIAE